MAANSAVRSWIWRKFELNQAFMIVLITCTNEKDPIKNGGIVVVTALYIDFSRTANSVVSSGTWPKFELILAYMVVCLACKNEEDPIKMKPLEWSQHYT